MDGDRKNIPFGPQKVPDDRELRLQQIVRDAKVYRCLECGEEWARRGGYTAHLCPNRCNGHFTKKQLRERGWRLSEISRIEPDLLLPNPHYRTAAPMALYYRRRIFALERFGKVEGGTETLQ